MFSPLIVYIAYNSAICRFISIYFIFLRIPKGCLPDKGWMPAHFALPPARSQLADKRLEFTTRPDVASAPNEWYCGWLRNPAPPKGCLKPYKYWDKPPINWCSISSIHRILGSRHCHFVVERGSIAGIHWFLQQRYAVYLGLLSLQMQQPFLLSLAQWLYVGGS